MLVLSHPATLLRELTDDGVEVMDFVVSIRASGVGEEVVRARAVEGVALMVMT